MKALSLKTLAAGAVFFALLAALLFAPYSYGVGTTVFALGTFIWTTWTGDTEMQHGLLVIPAVAFIIYYRRDFLKTIPVRGHWLGLVVLLFGLLMFWTGHRADVTTVGLYSLWFIIVGCVGWFLGLKMLLALSFPLAFLIFAIPMPGADTMIAFPLRMIMAKSSVFVLNLIGIPTVLQGTGILSAGDALTGLQNGQRFSVDVADPCSGIRSLFALMMVSALFGYFTLKETWQKWILFLCSIPLAILGNLCRILMLTFGVMSLGPKTAIGTLEEPSFFHMMAGYIVFAVALVGMIGVANLLGRVRPFISTLQNKDFRKNLTTPKKDPATPSKGDIY